MTPTQYAKKMINIILYYLDEEDTKRINEIFNETIKTEAKETLKRQLFIGKVSEIIGADKTLELLRESTNEIESYD